MPSLAFKIIEGTRSAGQSIFAHGFRSFLTTLGIIIGVASVIAVVSVVQGFSASISQEFDARQQTPVDSSAMGLSLAAHITVIGNLFLHLVVLSLRFVQWFPGRPARYWRWRSHSASTVFFVYHHRTISP